MIKQWLINWLIKDINRFEVINHKSLKHGIGRLIVIRSTISISLQDNNKTLKVFV